MPDGEPWGLRSSFICQTAVEQKVTNLPSSFYRQLLGLPEPWPGALSLRGQVCFATLSVQPWVLLLQRVTRTIHGVRDKAETLLSSSRRADSCSSFTCSAGRLLINPMVDQPWVWTMFKKVKCPVMSKKRDRLLPRVGLGDLMGYLLSVSQL